MDNTTMQLGLLLETAKTQQQLVEALLEKLKASTEQLGPIAREEFRGALRDELQGVSDQARQALEALQTLKRAANLRASLWALGTALAAFIVTLGLAWWVLPSRTEIEALRAERDQLQSNLAILGDHGGRADFRRCGERHLCIRVDLQEPRFGEQRDYFVIRGY